jgi:hypothetical protein
VSWQQHQQQQQQPHAWLHLMCALVTAGVGVHLIALLLNLFLLQMQFWKLLQSLQL